MLFQPVVQESEPGWEMLDSGEGAVSGLNLASALFSNTFQVGGEEAGGSGGGGGGAVGGAAGGGSGAGAEAEVAREVIPSFGKKNALYCI